MAREVISHLGVCVPGSNRGLSEYMYISFFFPEGGGGGGGRQYTGLVTWQSSPNTVPVII